LGKKRCVLTKEIPNPSIKTHFSALETIPVGDILQISGQLKYNDWERFQLHLTGILRICQYFFIEKLTALTFKYHNPSPKATCWF
jgi:hypothetical protein